MRFCTLCGEEIDSDAPHYYTKYRACYRGAKQQETASLVAEVAELRARAAKYRSLAIERRLKLEALEAGGGVSVLTPARITELLMLVHPDKRRNSPESNNATRWLLEVRARQRNAR